MIKQVAILNRKPKLLKNGSTVIRHYVDHKCLSYSGFSFNKKILTIGYHTKFSTGTIKRQLWTK